MACSLGQRRLGFRPMQIDRSKFEAYEAIILSGQMDAADVPAFLAANTEFADWYKARMTKRAPYGD